MEAWWQRDQIISAFIVGGFSMTATLVSMVVNGRRLAAKPRAKRPTRAARGRRLGVMFVAGLVIGGVGYRYGASAVTAFDAMALGSPLDTAMRGIPTLAPLFAAPPASRRAVAGVPVPPGRAVLVSAEPSPATARILTREDWLRSIGSRIYYRYAERLPDACDGPVVAHGNWVDGEAGQPVRCVDSAWLAFDVAGLVRAGKITRNVIYCFNIQSASGRWARHAPAISPGVDRVVIDSRTGSLGEAPLGFRVVRSDGLDRIEFLNSAPRVLC